MINLSKKIIRNGLLLFLALVMTLQTFSIQVLAEEKKIRVGTYDFPGMMDMDADGSYSGYAIDYLNTMSEYTGWEYEYVNDTWENLLIMLQEGDIDLLCTAQYSPQRDEIFDYAVNPLGYEGSDLYTRENDDRFYFNDYSAFDGMTVGVMKYNYLNSIFADYAEQHGFSYMEQEYTSYSQAFEALDSGKVDAVLSEGMERREGYKVVAEISADPFYMIVRQGNDELLNQIDDTMKQILINKPYYEEELYRKYFGKTADNAKPSFTREEAEYIASAGTITVGNQVNRFPICSIDGDGNIYGIQIDLMNTISEMSGLKFKYEEVADGIRAVDYMNEQSVRIFAGLPESVFATFSDEIVLSESMFTDSISFVTVRGNELNTTDNITIVIPAGYVNGEKVLSKVYPNATVEFCNTKEDCLDALVKGKAEFALLDTYMSNALLQKPKYESLISLYTYAEQQDFVVATLKTEDPRLMSILNKCIHCIGTNMRNNLITQYTVTSQYQLTFTDYLVKYRVWFIMITVLAACLLAALVLILTIQKHNEKRMKLANKKLAEAMQEAQRANNAKSQFLARMSHDMRTPMNTIINLTNMVEEELSDTEAAKEDLNAIKSSNRFLQGLIEDVLDMSRIESGKLQLHPERYSYPEFLGYMHSTFDALAAERNIEFTLTPGTEYVDIIIDKTRFNQVCFNLVSNALKYTEPGGHVSLLMNHVMPKDGILPCEIIVADDGIGISQEFQKNMFTPFEQEGRSFHTVEGVGLGLAIVKNILDAMGGTISVQSKENVGTTFTVNLDMVLAPKEETIKKRECDTSVLSGKHILLAEDHPMNQKISTRLLEKVGMTVSIAGNGQKAVDMFLSEEMHFDAILMDLRMPIMDGYAAAEAIRNSNRPDSKNIPIIAMTANSYQEDIDHCIKVGMNAHVSKPVEPQKMYEVMVKCIEK